MSGVDAAVPGGVPGVDAAVPGGVPGGVPGVEAAVPGARIRAASPADAVAINRLAGLSASTLRGLARDLARAGSEAAGAPVFLVAERGVAERGVADIGDGAGLPLRGERRDPAAVSAADVRGSGGSRDPAAVSAVDPRAGAAERAAASDAEVVGAALGLLQHDEGHVIDLAVAPESRRHGVGTQLLRALVAALLARGARAVTLEVRTSNLGAQALYRAAGFLIEGHRPGYYPDGEDALLLWWRPATGDDTIDAAPATGDDTIDAAPATGDDTTPRTGGQRC